MSGPDMHDLRATMALAHPKYARMTDPHDYPQTGAGQPAIRLVDYMGDYDDYYTNNLIGPYQDVHTRDSVLRDLRALPLGAPEFNGGYEFLPAVLTRGQRSVSPDRIEGVTTIKGFFDAFNGYGGDDADDLADVHPDQIPIF